MKTEIKGLTTYVGALLVLLAGAWFGLQSLPSANILISRAVAASADYRAEQAKAARASQPDERAAVADDVSSVRAASDGAWKPPTIRRNFSSFYSDYDLAPLPKLAKSTKKPQVMAAEQRPRKVRRRALPKEIYAPQPAPNAFAFCIFC